MTKERFYKMIWPPIFLLAAALLSGSDLGANRKPLRYPEPDDRYKADLLLVVAHPDDETAIGSYLAKAVFDDQRRVAIIYTNRGSGGGNSMGIEKSLAMGAEREIEVRKAVAEFGIFSVWFLDGRDTPGQDVFHSLGNLNHGASLEKLIRLIRLTRPEVIMTWLPHYVSGENHGDHQAAGVLATEAFDLAGDPTVFPAQVTPPREPQDIDNFNEGLHPWQPKKLYYFSDRDLPLAGYGPVFNLETVSSVKGVPYYQLASRLNVHHQTQGEVADIAELALNTGDWGPFLDFASRFHLIFGKSVVGSCDIDPVFSGINEKPVDYVPMQALKTKRGRGIDFQLGGSFNYYRQFWKAHGIEHLENLIEPEMMVSVESYVHVPLLVYNHTKKDATITIESILPEGWSDLQGDNSYLVQAGGVFPIQTFYFAPDEPTDQPHLLRLNARDETREIGTIEIMVDIREWTLPQ